MEEILSNELASLQPLSQPRTSGTISWSPPDAYEQQYHDGQNVDTPSSPRSLPRSSQESRNDLGATNDDDDDVGVGGASASDVSVGAGDGVNVGANGVEAAIAKD
ncbi:hypothetical protein CJ030_MR2G022268 [Morella rubra]|uniref:Uncharacterized protein n=1 Tax=Morella rubra TaxID=262757 RepID=A0A6A1WFY0_9ROSI|nr:hypothetical protein CJ030_MR2G022268 [Morella rubra]